MQAVQASTTILRFPTARKYAYRSPSLSTLTAIPANVHDLWADRVQRMRESDAELVTVQITRGMFNAIRRLQELEVAQ